jgi:Ca2+-binding EF-hand superfamily protein
MASREGEKDGDSISLREFYKLLSERGIDENIIKRVFERADVNDDDELSERELKLAFSILRRLASKEGEGKERESDRTTTLREFISRFGKRMDDDKLKRIFNKADSNGDGELNRREMVKALAMMKCDDRKERSRVRTHFRMVDRNSDGVPETIHLEVHIDGDEVPDLVIEMVDKNSDGNPEIVEMESNLPPEMMMLILGMIRDMEKTSMDEKEDWKWEDKPEYEEDMSTEDDGQKERKDEEVRVDGARVDLETGENDMKSVQSEGSDEGISSTLLAAMISAGIILLIGIVGGSFLLMKKIYG